MCLTGVNWKTRHICGQCKESEEEIASLTPAGIAVLERLDEIADKWGLSTECLSINPFMLAGARDEARRAGIEWFDTVEDAAVSETVEQ